MKNKVSNRQERVAMLITRALNEELQRGKIFGGLLDTSPISITKIEVTADLGIAKCYYLPFNTQLTLAQIAEFLNKLRFTFRKVITDQVKLKYSPEIRFYYDDAFDNLAKVEKLLKDLS